MIQRDFNRSVGDLCTHIWGLLVAVLPELATGNKQPALQIDKPKRRDLALKEQFKQKGKFRHYLLILIDGQ